MTVSPETSADSIAPWQPARLRVPRTDGSRLIAPPPADCLSLPSATRSRLAAAETCRLQGRTLPQLRLWTRQQVLQAASEYTRELEESACLARPAAPAMPATSRSVESADQLLLVSGHQPAPAHPGVWLKNSLMHQLARELPGALSLNLIVDQDLFSGPEMRVPVGTRLHPRIESLAWDAPGPVGPWEEAGTRDEQLFATFGQRMAQAMSHWNIRPVIADWWQVAVQHGRITHCPADRLTAARHAIEQSWGLANLELPLSRVCQLEPFLWFASHLLVNLPRFVEVHNQVLAQYRLVNGIRSRNHPVPELETTADGRWEAPLWVWQSGDTQRQRVYARQEEKHVVLSAGTSDFARLPLTPRMDACCAVEELQKLPSRGIRLRTRALATTLFARLCLADLFVHGIGGAKYDEMTDRILLQFYGIEPPPFVTASGTLLLPFARPFPVTPGSLALRHHHQRDRRDNPERFGALPPASDGTADDTAALLERKQLLIAAQHAARQFRGTRSQRRARSRANRARFFELRELNRPLAARQNPAALAAADDSLAREAQELDANKVLQNREFQSWLYPEEPLRDFLSASVLDPPASC